MPDHIEVFQLILGCDLELYLSLCIPCRVFLISLLITYMLSLLY